MPGLAQASCQLTRVPDANSRSAKGWPRNRTKYSYDGNGNATARQGNSITWTSYNYPVTVNAGSGSTAETVAFSYGPDRKRWQQMYTGNGTSETTNYVGGLLEVVLSGSTTTYRHYINAGSEPVAVYARSSAGNTFSYVLSDHQGSNSDLTNSSGTSIVNESFTPFGERRNPTTWSGAASNSDLTTAAGITRQGYTSQTQLGLWMGMNHMNGRVEDSITGRMLSADPHVPDRSNTQSYNRYSYANNNPLTLTDPSGFCTPRWACKQDAGGGGGASWADRHGVSSDPFNGVGDGTASAQGVSGVDATGSDTNISDDGTAEITADINQTIATLSAGLDAALSAGDGSPYDTPTGGAGSNPGVTPNNAGVSINWLSATLINAAGGYVAQASFTVPPGGNGVLLQQMNFNQPTSFVPPMDISQPSFNWLPLPSAPPTYYEAWTATNGVVSPSSYTGANDKFQAPTAGYTPQTGLVQFYPGATMSNFPELQPPGSPNSVGAAGGLYSSGTQPANWTSQGALPHQVSVTTAPTLSGYQITCTPTCN